MIGMRIVDVVMSVNIVMMRVDELVESLVVLILMLVLVVMMRFLELRVESRKFSFVVVMKVIVLIVFIYFGSVVCFLVFGCLCYCEKVSRNSSSLSMIWMMLCMGCDVFGF